MAVSLLFEALEERERTDRRMKFRVWLIVGILTLGIGLFVALYFLIKRMRDHFRRQRKLEMGIIELLRSRGIDETTLRELQAIHEEAKREEKERNPVLWAILLLIPIVDTYVLYRISVDIWGHVIREIRFMTIASAALSQLGISLPEEELSKEVFHSKRDLLILVALSLVIRDLFEIVWLYILFRRLNKHFEAHRAWEEALRSSLQSLR